MFQKFLECKYMHHIYMNKFIINNVSKITDVHIDT